MGEPLREPQDPPTVDRGYEHSDVAIRPLMYFLVGLALTLVLAGAVVAGLFFLLERQAQRQDPIPSPLAQEAQPIPGPLLQVLPQEHLTEFRERQQQRLDATEWVDEPRGIARIPIDQAMELTLKDGLPTWPAAPPAGGAQP